VKDGWQEIQSIGESVNKAHNAMGEITQWLYRNVVGNDVLPREMPEPLNANLAALAEELDAVRRAAENASSYFAPGPLALLHGLPLSRAEYFIYQARGMEFGTAREVGLSRFDDYYVYQMLCYQDEESRGYINVNLTPIDPNSSTDGVRVVGMRFGRAPEECRRRHLRPEQEHFFRQYLPTVYVRFSED